MVGKERNDSGLVAAAHVGGKAQLELALVVRDLVGTRLTLHLSEDLENLLQENVVVLAKGRTQQSRARSGARTCLTPVAPTGWPKPMRPPPVLTGNLPSMSMRDIQLGEPLAHHANG